MVIVNDKKKKERIDEDSGIILGGEKFLSVPWKQVRDVILI